MDLKLSVYDDLGDVLDSLDEVKGRLYLGCNNGPEKLNEEDKLSENIFKIERDIIHLRNQLSEELG